jgi:hypothetical protein
VFVLDRQGRLLLRLSGNQYTPRALDKFVRALGVPVTDFPDVVVRLWSGAPVYGDLEEKEGFVTVTEFDQAHPGLLSKKDFRRVGESPVLLVGFRIGAALLVVALVLVVLKLIFDFT